MTDRASVQRHFEEAVKLAATRISNRVLDFPGSRQVYLNEFGRCLDRLIEERDQALEKLERVKIEQVHLETVAQYIRDVSTEIGCKQGKYRFFHNIACFATHGECPEPPPHDDICRACQAIWEALKDDC